MSIKTAIRGAMLSFRKDPFFHDMDDCLVYESDAVVVMENGKIVKTGAADKILPELDGVPVKRYADSLIIPGFIDCHVHYPQTEIIAAYGEQLIEWLNNYTFVAEQGFKNKEHADEVAEVFLREQVRNGVTSSTVYCTVFRSRSMRFLKRRRNTICGLWRAKCAWTETLPPPCWTRRSVPTTNPKR